MVGILTAMPFEKEDILKISKPNKSETICKIDFITGTINDTPIVIAACGEGKVNASKCAQIMVDYFHVSLILNVGVAGAMNGMIKKKDIIVADKVVQHDYNMTAIGVPVGMVPRGKRSKSIPWGEEAKTFIHCSKKMVTSICNTLDRLNLNYKVGTIATGDLFVAEEKKKMSILSSFDVLACEMEGAAIAYVCDCAGIEFAEIRDISDNADSKAEESYFSYREKYNLAQILLEVLSDLGEKMKNIKTKRFLLRKVLPTDSKSIFDILSDSETVKYLNMPKMNSIEDSSELILDYQKKYEIGEKFPFAIIDSTTDTFVGVFLIKLDVFDDDCFEFTVYIKKEYWNHGVYSEILPHMVNFAFTTIKTGNFRGFVMINNKSSSKVLKKSGFRLEKTFTVAGLPEPIESYLITKQEYFNSHN